MQKLHREVIGLVGGIMLMLSLGAVRSAAAEETGSWRFEKDAGDHPSLEYLQGDKVIFDISVGRAISLWVAYPGPSQPDGKATITIVTASKKWKMKGELTNDHDFKGFDERATYFLQSDMGLSRPKPEFNNLTRRFNDFINSMAASKKITISTEAGDVILPKITIAKLRQRFGV